MCLLSVIFIFFSSLSSFACFWSIFLIYLSQLATFFLTFFFRFFSVFSFFLRSVRVQLSVLFLVYVFTEIIHPYYFVYLRTQGIGSDKNNNSNNEALLPFLPLMMTSCTCAVLLVPCWIDSGLLLFT